MRINIYLWWENSFLMSLNHTGTFQIKYIPAILLWHSSLPTPPLILSLCKPFHTTLLNCRSNPAKPACPLHVFTEFWFASEGTNFQCWLFSQPSHELRVQEERLAIFLLPIRAPIWLLEAPAIMSTTSSQSTSADILLTSLSSKTLAPGSPGSFLAQILLFICLMVIFIPMTHHRHSLRIPNVLLCLASHPHRSHTVDVPSSLMNALPNPHWLFNNTHYNYNENTLQYPSPLSSLLSSLLFLSWW